MVEGDVRERDDGSVEHVRRVKAAAQARLDDRDVDLRRLELGERSRGHRLELRRGEALRRRTDSLDRDLEVGVFAVDLDPLAPARDVRRRVGADRQALPTKERSGAAGRRRLAVRADDVDRTVRALRLAELRE